MKAEMRNLWWGLFILTMGCAPALQVNRVSPKISSNRPRTIMIITPYFKEKAKEAIQTIEASGTSLKETTTSYENANAPSVIENALLEAANSTGKYKFISLAEIYGELDEDSKKIVEMYISELRKSGFSNPDLARKIGEKVKVDALFISEILRFDTMHEVDEWVVKVGIHGQLINCRDNSILWDVVHTEKSKFLRQTEMREESIPIPVVNESLTVSTKVSQYDIPLFGPKNYKKVAKKMANRIMKHLP